MVPWLTDGTIVGLVAKVLGGIEPVTEKGSLSDRVVLGRNGGSGENTETEYGDSSDSLSGEVHY
jgi:hypothetical protein